MRRKIISMKLSAPIEMHGKTISVLELREPSARQFLSIGPIVATFTKNGIAAAHDIEGALIRYLEGGCLLNVDPAHIEIVLGDLPLVDGVRLRRTFASFFDEAIELVLAEEAATAAAVLVAAAPLAAAHEAVSAALGAPGAA